MNGIKFTKSNRNGLMAIFMMAIALAGLTDWRTLALMVAIAAVYMLSNSFEKWAETQTQTPLSFKLSDPALMEDGPEDDWESAGHFDDEIDILGDIYDE